MEDLQNASKLLVKALKIRERYMTMSQQSFPSVTKKFLKRLDGKDSSDDSVHSDKATIEGELRKRQLPIISDRRLQ